VKYLAFDPRVPGKRCRSRHVPRIRFVDSGFQAGSGFFEFPYTTNVVDMEMGEDDRPDPGRVAVQIVPDVREDCLPAPRYPGIDNDKPVAGDNVGIWCIPGRISIAGSSGAV
jgi:hypothetical protein